MTTQKVVMMVTWKDKKEIKQPTKKDQKNNAQLQ